MTRKRHEDYSNMVQRLYASADISANHALCRNITFQVTSGCNLRCSYCYEHHKGTERMSIETGRKIVDYLLDLYEQGDSDFINRSTRAVVLDFIGGELPQIHPACSLYQNILRNEWKTLVQP